MNVCFVKGKIIEEVEFQFFYRSKHNSIAKTRLLLENGSELTIKGYDEMADWLYQQGKIGMKIWLQGKLDSNMEVRIEWVMKSN